MDISRPRPSLVSLVKVPFQWACRKLQQCLKRKEPHAGVARQDSHDLRIFQDASAEKLTKFTDHWRGSNEHPQRPRFYLAAIGHSTTAARPSVERPPVKQPSIAQSSNEQPSVQNLSVEALPVQALPLECPIFENPVVEGLPVHDPPEWSAATDVPSMAPRHPSIRISQLSIDFERILQAPNMEVQHEKPFTTNRRAVSMDTPLISQKDRRRFLRNTRLFLRQNSGLNSDAENTPSLVSNSSSISDNPSVVGTLPRPQSKSSVSSFSSLRLVEWGQRTLYDIRSIGIRGAATL